VFLYGKVCAWWCLFLLAIGVCSVVDAQEFTRAVPDYSWSFPADHGQHPAYKTEWWYYTGQLYNEGDVVFKDKPAYGFQLTFFRRSTKASDGSIASEYMAHAALTDLQHGKTIFSSRLGGGALGLAKTDTDSLSAASGDWTVDEIAKKLVLRFSVRDDSEPSPIEIRIVTDTLPEPWLQGAKGFSQKATCEGCASMYYSMPRIGLVATVNRAAQKRQQFHGFAWMDHEFMTNSLGDDQVGWDWFGLMLKDGRSIMLFQLRGESSTVSFSSAGISDGAETKVLKTHEFSLTPVAYWRSLKSGASYPVSWRVVIPSEGIDTVVRTRTNSCEVGSVIDSGDTESGVARYWEGPVASADESVVGYLEMTGYAGKISGL
jgi:predicted secreted hydrolase